VNKKLRVLLICHEKATLDRYGLPRWLASFSHLAGLIVLKEPGRLLLRRIKREIERTGIARFSDVAAFRMYYMLFRARRDRIWEERKLAEISAQYPRPPGDTPEIVTSDPNGGAAEKFIRSVQPDLMIARCKVILKRSVYALPPLGTFVFHPGICPEYRNAHGCFWAIVNNETEKVGMTLLRIDQGVDTGPVYAYYSSPRRGTGESHIIIQHKAVLANLDRLRDKLLEIHAGTAVPLNTSGRRSASWGQPWLTRYLKWKYTSR